MEANKNIIKNWNFSWQWKFRERVNSIGNWWKSDRRYYWGKKNI